MSHKIKLVMIFTMLIGGFFGLLNETLLTTALPKIMQDLNVDYTQVQWLITAFLLTNGIAIPLSAFITQRFTTRQVFITAVSIFLVGTLLGAVSPDFNTLLAARIIQALGSGMMMPLMMTTILDIFPPDQRGKYMGMFGLVIGLAPAIGPTLSGYLVEYFHWRALFYVVAPIALIALLISLKFVKNVGTTVKLPIDMLSVVLSILGFGGILYGTSAIAHDGWENPVVLVSIIGGMILVTLFVIRQLKLEVPLLNFSVFKNRQFSIGLIIMAFTMVSMIGSETVLPMFVQNLLGHTALESGLMLLPGAIVMGIMSVLSGILFERYGAKILSIIGMSIVIITTTFFVFMTTDTTALTITTVYTIRMVGLALGLMPLMTHTLNQLDMHMNAHGASMTNTVQQIAASIGTAILITIMTHATKQFSPVASDYSGSKMEIVHAMKEDALLHGYNTAFLFAVIISVISLICAFMLTSKKNTPTVQSTEQ